MKRAGRLMKSLNQKKGGRAGAEASRPARATVQFNGEVGTMRAEQASGASSNETNQKGGRRAFEMDGRAIKNASR